MWCDVQTAISYQNLKMWCFLSKFWCVFILLFASIFTADYTIHTILESVSLNNLWLKFISFLTECCSTASTPAYLGFWMYILVWMCLADWLTSTARWAFKHVPACLWREGGVQQVNFWLWEWLCRALSPLLSSSHTDPTVQHCLTAAAVCGHQQVTVLRILRKESLPLRQPKMVFVVQKRAFITCELKTPRHNSWCSPPEVLQLHSHCSHPTTDFLKSDVPVSTVHNDLYVWTTCEVWMALLWLPVPLLEILQ